MFPKTKRKRPLQPFESLISIDKARTVLGYEPKHDYKPAKRGTAAGAKKAAAKGR